MMLKESLALIEKALPGNYSKYELHEPYFDAREEQYVLDCIKTRWVSYQGDYVNRFETMLAQVCQVNHAIALASGTVALHLALSIIGIGRGDEVIIPSLTFVATANAVMHCGAIPNFVDVAYSNFAIDPEKLDKYLERIIEFDTEGNALNTLTKNRVKAIIPVHIFGHPVDLASLTKIAKKYRLIIIEDAAEAIGSYYKNQHVGNVGKLSILSFNGNKVITTGGGGAIITNDDQLAEKIRYLSTTAKRPHRYDFFHDEVGYNFRMPNINAAIGVAQLEKLDDFLLKKRKLAKHYSQAFARNEFFDFLVDEPNTISNYWLNAIMIKPEYKQFKNQLLDQLHDKGIKCRPIWNPLHTLPMYKDMPKDHLDCTNDLFERVICLPSSVFLMDDKQ